MVYSIKPRGSGCPLLFSIFSLSLFSSQLSFCNPGGIFISHGSSINLSNFPPLLSGDQDDFLVFIIPNDFYHLPGLRVLFQEDNFHWGKREEKYLGNIIISQWDSCEWREVEHE